MKYIGLFLASLALVMLGCGGGKQLYLDKSPYLEIENPYWQEIYSGIKDGENSIVLFLPYATPIESYKVDSVYFKGYHDALKTSIMEEKTVYRVRLIKDENREKVIPPYEITEDQALVSYVNKAGEKYYFIVDNIVKAEPIYMP